MALRITVKVRPYASKNEIKKIENDIIYVNVSAPLQKGKANEELINYFSKIFKLHKTNITITSGKRSRIKRLKIKMDEFSFNRIISLLKKRI